MTSVVDRPSEEPDASGTRWNPGPIDGPTELMCVIPFVVSSGGFDAPDLDALDSSNTAYSVGNRAGDRSEELSVPRTSDSLAQIRAVLGTNVTQTAEVLRVKRQTIYAWLANRTSPQLTKQARLDQVLAIVLQWSRISRKSLRAHLCTSIGGGQSLLQLLSQEDLPVSEIEQRLERLSKVKPALKSARDWAMELGLDVPSEEEQLRALDRETGKRISSE